MHDDEGEVITTIHAGQPREPQVRPLEQCPTCHRYIDRVCSVCPPPVSAPVTPEESRRRHEELREQGRRERAWYERGGR